MSQNIKQECKKFVTDVVRRELMQVIINKGKIEDVGNIVKVGETARQYFVATNSKKPQEK